MLGSTMALVTEDVINYRTEVSLRELPTFVSLQNPTAYEIYEFIVAGQKIIVYMFEVYTDTRQ